MMAFGTGGGGLFEGGVVGAVLLLDAAEHLPQLHLLQEALVLLQGRDGMAQPVQVDRR